MNKNNSITLNFSIYLFCYSLVCSEPGLNDLKVGKDLCHLASNSNCRKHKTNCSNVYPLIQFLKISG